jgi:putative endonuclease
MTDKMQTGDNGENLAADFLIGKGYTIVARKYRSRQAEIDLIAKRDDWLVFIEVKTRSSNAWGEPEAFVNSAKTRLIYYAAEDYIFKTNWQGNIRFDIISVKLGPYPELVHFDDAIVY